jgi:hypothetical protein
MLPKLLFMAVCISFLTSSIKAQQNIFFKFNDGTSAAYTVNEIRNVTFSGNVIVLQKKDGTTINWNASTVGNYRFDATTSVRDAERINNAEVKIYPNPFKGAVRIRFEMPVADKVAVDILDMQGRIIHQWPKAQKKAGMHELLWQSNDSGSMVLKSGTYICRITTTKGTVSKTMVVE